MSSERVRVTAKTRWRKSVEHAWHEKGESFMAPREWLPNRHLVEDNDDGNESADTKPAGDGGPSV